MHHALTCPTGGFPSQRHDELRDIFAVVLREVCPDVETEPSLMELSGEQLRYSTANRGDEDRLDIRARGFWTRQQQAFFDVRVTTIPDDLTSLREIRQHLRNHEESKKREYGDRVREVEKGVFTPLVLSSNGLSAKECSIFIKSLVNKIVEKFPDRVYSMVMSLLRVRISFSLLRSAICCLRGSRRCRFSRMSVDLSLSAALRSFF